MHAQCVWHNTASKEVSLGWLPLPSLMVMLSCDPLLLLLQIHIHKPWKNGTFVANFRCHAIFLVSRIVYKTKRKSCPNYPRFTSCFTWAVENRKVRVVCFQNNPEHAFWGPQVWHSVPDSLLTLATWARKPSSSHSNSLRPAPVCASASGHLYADSSASGFTTPICSARGTLPPPPLSSIRYRKIRDFAAPSAQSQSPIPHHNSYTQLHTQIRTNLSRLIAPCSPDVS